MIDDVTMLQLKFWAKLCRTRLKENMSSYAALQEQDSLHWHPALLIGWHESCLTLDKKECSICYLHRTHGTSRLPLTAHATYTN